METEEKNEDLKQIELEKLKYQDEPFYYVESDQEKPFPPLFWLQWGLLLVVGFYFASILMDGFGNMHRYGINEATGQNYIFLINDIEKIFYAALLFCLPAAIFFTLFTENFVKPKHMQLMDRVFDGKNAKPILIVLLVMAVAIILFFSLVVLKQKPISDDENVYIFQTRILSNGSFTLPGKEGDDALFDDNVFLVNNGRIFGQYPFGHSVVLLLGYIIGFINLTQILFAALTILGAYLLGKELYGARTGLLCAFLIAVSPSFLFTSSTLLSHTNTLFFLTWFGYFAVKTVNSDKWFYPVLCGLAFGGAFQIRGATTLLVALPASLLLAFVLLKKPKTNLLKIVLVGGTVGLGAGLFLFLNWHVNGDMFHTNYHAAWIGKTQFDSPFGFGKGAWRIIHSPQQGALNAVNNLIRMNAWVFGWPVGFLFVFVWAARKGRKVVDFVLLAPIVITFVGYFFYFWPGISDTGPVLYFELLLPMALLTARGIEKTPELLTKFMPADKAKLRTRLFVIFSVVIAVGTFHFYNAKALAKLPGVFDEPYSAMKVPPGEKAVVFTDYYFRETGQKSWVAGRKSTHQDLSDNVLYALDFGRTKDEEYLQKYYPDHKGYVFHYREGRPVFIPLTEYTIKNFLKNYPDSR